MKKSTQHLIDGFKIRNIVIGNEPKNRIDRAQVYIDAKRAESSSTLRAHIINVWSHKNTVPHGKGGG
jgi:hypothetical protein